MSSNLPPGVTDAMIEDAASWPEFDQFVDWLASQGMRTDISLEDMKALWSQSQAIMFRTHGEIEERVVAAIRERRNRGRLKYGVSMERTDLTLPQWLQHAQEEALDFCIYAEKLKRDFPFPMSEETESLNKPPRWGVLYIVLIGILAVGVTLFGIWKLFR